MKKILVFLFLFSVVLVSAQELKYHRVAIDLGKTSLKTILEAGITIDHSYRHDNVIETEISDLEIKSLVENNIPYKVQIYDMAMYYAARNAADMVQSAGKAVNGCNDPNLVVPSHFHLGSMGGYFTLSEMENIIDSMALLYPNLVKAKAPISTTKTHEGRNIWYVKLSDNPNVDENEPEILYTSLHHAREGGSLSQLIFYMWYLLENYATNPDVQAVLRNTELYFVPCVNPDGYVFNQQTNPGGGGMWRKNRRDNGNGSFGIDLNRNYGVNWGYDNSGSSPSTSSDVYRGTAPFSEPETQAMKTFCEARNFKNCINAHTFANDFIYPWGHIPDFHTPDSVTYKKWSALLTKDSHFHYGTCNQTLGYNINGGADDWMYGEQTTKGKIFSMTPESGSYYDGFWPVSSRIIDICKLTFSQNLNVALLALNYTDLQDREDKFISTNGYLKYAVTPLGNTAGTFTVKITPVGGIASVGVNKVYTSVPRFTTVVDSISYTLGNGLAAGQQLQYILTVDDGYASLPQLITKIYGVPVTLLFENGTTTSTLDPQGMWDVTTSEFVSPPSSITDSPFGNYSPNVTKYLQTGEMDLTNAAYAHVQFYTRYLIEKTHDQVLLNISVDNGANYTALCGKYSTPVSSNPGSVALYDGRQDDWVLEEIDLSLYLNKKVRLRFELNPDSYNEKDGFYIDDLLVRKIIKPVVGLAENALNGLVNIHPNPSQGRFTIESGDHKIMQVTVYNSLGEKVVERSATGNGPVTVDLSDQSAGVYFFCVKTEKNTELKKMILNR